MLFNKELLVFHFISFHWSYSLHWSIKHQVLHVLLLSYFRFWEASICNAKNNLDFSNLKQFWANKKYSIAPLGIGLRLNSSLVHILRSLFIQQVCGSVKIQGAAVQITDGYLSTKSLQVAKFVQKRNWWALRHLIKPNQFQ